MQYLKALDQKAVFDSVVAALGRPRLEKESFVTMLDGLIACGEQPPTKLTELLAYLLQNCNVLEISIRLAYLYLKWSQNVWPHQLCRFADMTQTLLARGLDSCDNTTKQLMQETLELLKKKQQLLQAPNVGSFVMQSAFLGFVEEKLGMRLEGFTMEVERLVAALQKVKDESGKFWATLALFCDDLPAEKAEELLESLNISFESDGLKSTGLPLEAFGFEGANSKGASLAKTNMRRMARTHCQFDKKTLTDLAWKLAKDSRLYDHQEYMKHCSVEEKEALAQQFRPLRFTRDAFNAAADDQDALKPMLKELKSKLPAYMHQLAGAVHMTWMDPFTQAPVPWKLVCVEKIGEYFGIHGVSPFLVMKQLQRYPNVSSASQFTLDQFKLLTRVREVYPSFPRIDALLADLIYHLTETKVSLADYKGMRDALLNICTSFDSTAAWAMLPGILAGREFITDDHLFRKCIVLPMQAGVDVIAVLMQQYSTRLDLSEYQQLVLKIMKEVDKKPLRPRFEACIQLQNQFAAQSFEQLHIMVAQPLWEQLKSLLGGVLDASDAEIAPKALRFSNQLVTAFACCLDFVHTRTINIFSLYEVENDEVQQFAIELSWYAQLIQRIQRVVDGFMSEKLAQASEAKAPQMREQIAAIKSNLSEVGDAVEFLLAAVGAARTRDMDDAHPVSIKEMLSQLNDKQLKAQLKPELFMLTKKELIDVATELPPAAACLVASRYEQTKFLAANLPNLDTCTLELEELVELTVNVREIGLEIEDLIQQLKGRFGSQEDFRPALRRCAPVWLIKQLQLQREDDVGDFIEINILRERELSPEDLCAQLGENLSAWGSSEMGCISDYLQHAIALIISTTLRVVDPHIHDVVSGTKHAPIDHASIYADVCRLVESARAHFKLLRNQKSAGKQDQHVVLESLTAFFEKVCFRSTPPNVFRKLFALARFSIAALDFSVHLNILRAMELTNLFIYGSALALQSNRATWLFQLLNQVLHCGQLMEQHDVPLVNRVGYPLAQRLFAALKYSDRLKFVALEGLEADTALLGPLLTQEK